MTNLLYVTKEMIQKLKHHKAYYFWLPIIQNFPIRNIPIEERSFHPRNIEISNGYIYLTIDMKFAYARDNMFSFLYENQDLSYRFSVFQGILRTLDNKQFTALVGKIGRVTGSTDIELVETDKVYHPLFDSGALTGTPPSHIKLNNIDDLQKQPGKAKQTQKGDDSMPKKRRGRPRKNPISDNVSIPSEPVKVKGKRGRPPRRSVDIAKKTTSSNNDELILGQPKSLCAEIYTTKTKEKKNYEFLSQKYGLDKQLLRKICKTYRNLIEAVDSTNGAKSTG